VPEIARRALSVRDYASRIRFAAAKLLGSSRENGSPEEPLVTEPWTVDQVDLTDNEVVVRGWSLPPVGIPSTAIGPIEFRINGRRCQEARYPLARPEVGAVFWQRPNAGLSGFECRAPVPNDPYPDGVMVIERVRVGASPVERGRDCWFVPDPRLHEDLPDEDRRYRIVGHRDPIAFLATGATDYHRLDMAVAAICGRPLHQFRSVLDWGCGCGRVARHFPVRHANRLTGCDIDHDNANWCSNHLPGRFLPCTMTPPLPFAAAEFDLVYGVSVFTHLREPLQQAWLDELARVTSKAAFLLMTIHCRSALEFARLLPDEYARVRSDIDHRGLLVTGENPHLDGYADHGGEYVNVFHTHKYVRRTWSRHFDVVAVIPGYIFTQDLVILRRH